MIANRASDSRYQDLWARIRRAADGVTRAGKLELPEDTFLVYYYVRQRLMDLALATLVTRDRSYADAVDRVVRDLATRDRDDAGQSSGSDDGYHRDSVYRLHRL